MTKLKLHIVFCFVLSILTNILFAQLNEDSLKLVRVNNNGDSIKFVKKANDSTSTKKNVLKHDPKIATRRSFILPGWGQAYNKEYWKIPLVYGALSIPTITFIYNNGVYKEAKTAYEYRYAFAQTSHTPQDSLNVLSLDKKYQNADINAIQTLRNAARRDRDYSIFWFVIVWGLNVADATVFGHLKEFDVSNNLSMKVHPQFNPITKTPALGLTFKFKEKKKILVEAFSK